MYSQMLENIYTPFHIEQNISYFKLSVKVCYNSVQFLLHCLKEHFFLDFKNTTFTLFSISIILVVPLQRNFILPGLYQTSNMPRNILIAVFIFT